MKRLALVSLPWPLINRPSAQLGVLKAFLRSTLPQMEVDCFHPFLTIARAMGVETYNVLAADGWAGEAVAAAVLFPENKKQAEKLFYRSLARRKHKASAPFSLLTEIVQEQLHNWAATGPFPATINLAPRWGGYGAVGFTVTFNQLCSSLLAAKLLKERWPHILTVFGGSAVAGASGESMQKTFPQLDRIISGEGEGQLTEFCRRFLCQEGNVPETPCGTPALATTSQKKDLSHLPCPVYDDFFLELKATFGNAPFSPVLPVEFSRGCWWNRCAFCNLNIQWQGYRFKKAAQVAHDIETLAKKHQCLDFAFCDNVLPPAEAKKFFARRLGAAQEIRFFAEIRATEKKETLAAYRRGGLTTVQVGIEALSNPLLKKMDKGVTVADNLMAMKNAAACDMTLEGNLITEFPGSTDDEVQETLACLDLVFPFHPLSTAVFFLGHGSPVDCAPKTFGLGGVTRHPFHRLLFPRPILDGLTLLVKGYRGDRAVQRKRWRPVVQRVKEWQKFHETKRSCRPLLALRDGGSFCCISQTLPDGGMVTHRLSGLSRKVYLYCDEKKSFAQVRETFREISADALHDFLRGLCAKKIFYMDEKECLSLAPRQTHQ